MLVLAAGWSPLGRRGLTIAAIGLAAGAMLDTLPRIHDITTDTQNPPSCVAALPARAAENAASATYAGPEIAKQQDAARPGLAPLKVDLSPE